MLTNSYFHQTSRRLFLSVSQIVSSYSRSNKIQSTTYGTISINYSTLQNSLNKIKIDTNDSLETKRLEDEEKKTTDSSSTPSTSSISSTSRTHVQDTRVLNTFVLPGIPVTTPVQTLASEQQHIGKEKEEQQYERIPSSRFSAFLRSIRSGLTFFPSKKNVPSSMDIATTREHFIPVSYFNSLLSINNQHFNIR